MYKSYILNGCDISRNACRKKNEEGGEMMINILRRLKIEIR